LAAASALNYLVVEHAAPGAGQKTLLVDLFAAVAATMLTIWLTARYEAGIRRIASGLSEVARGRRDLRFDVGREPLVANLAHAANECIGSLVEPVDPSIGPVRVRKRLNTGEQRVISSPDHATPAEDQARATARVTPVPPSTPLVVTAQPHVPSTAGPTPPDVTLAPAVVAPPSVSNMPTLPPGVASAPPPVEEHTLAPLPEPGPVVSPTVGATTNPTGAPPRNPSQLPTVLPPATSQEPVKDSSSTRNTPIPDSGARQEHFRTVFEEYRAALKRVGEDDGGMTLDGFQETLVGTEKALMDRHSCRGVRFSVLVEDGRVQLLPRLVR